MLPTTSEVLDKIKKEGREHKMLFFTLIDTAVGTYKEKSNK